MQVQIFTWKSETAPENQRWIARIRLNGKFWQVNILSSTENGAIEKAESFFESEIERTRSRMGEKGRKKAAPEVRYWHHPESCCVFTTGPEGLDNGGDGLTEEIDHAEFEDLERKYAEPAPAEPSNDIDDLLA